MKKLYGTGVALVTPFDQSLNIDFKALTKLVRHTSKGADYLVVMGTTGESPTCSAEEKRAVLEHVIKVNDGRLPVVYGIGGNHTAEVVKTIAETPLRGVDALLSVSPYYNKPSQEGIYRHFTSVADASPVPVILYNVPGRTSSNIAAETTLRLAGHGNIAGIKEASGNIEQCMRIARGAPRNFLLISGDDLLTVPLYAIGAVGVISVLANAYPSVFRRMKNFAGEGRYEKAAQEQFRLLEINGPMYEEGNPVGIKYVLSRLGVCGPYVRQPLAPASRALTARIDAVMSAMK